MFQKQNKRTKKEQFNKKQWKLNKSKLKEEQVEYKNQIMESAPDLVITL
jgi:hypothetical protein